MLAANGLYCPRFVLDLKPAAARQTGGGGRLAAAERRRLRLFFEYLINVYTEFLMGVFHTKLFQIHTTQHELW